MMKNFMSRKNIKIKQNFKGGVQMKYLLITLMTITGVFAADCAEKAGEYFRYGLKWDEWCKN